MDVNTNLFANNVRALQKIAVKDGAVRTSVEVTGSKSAGFTHETVWRLGADGALTLENTVTPHGTMPRALPRLGLSMGLSADLADAA